MNILAELDRPESWREFYEYKRAGGHLNRQELRELEEFIETEQYRPVIEQIRCGEGFAPPKKREISKMHSEKKRVVYTYAAAENQVLKLMTFFLHRKYDALFAENLYSFRPGIGVRDAVKRLIRTRGIRQMWSYKVDISNYFNSIPVEKLLPTLRNVLAEEPEISRFLEILLTDPRVEEKGALVEEPKGIMAGTPVSTFLANLYLCHMDDYFQKREILYARYSDDIITFAKTEEELQQNVQQIHRFLAEAGLTINPAKEEWAKPGETWTFLGVCYRDGVIDVAPVSVEKLKAKMRRKTRALVRWKARSHASGEKAAMVFIRVFHRKLFENPVDHELTWIRWYFPLINTVESLQVIDQYRQECIRYLATGVRTKAAYQFRYEQMKELGYVSLVNSYYRHSRERFGAEKTQPGVLPGKPAERNGNGAGTIGAESGTDC